MRKRNRTRNLSLCVGGLILTGAVGHGYAQTLTGNLNTTGVNYGQNVAGAPPFSGQLSTQTIISGYGQNTDNSGYSNGGSELDAAYGTISNNTLYLFFAGNMQNSGNHLCMFFSDGSSNGQSTLNISNGWTAAGMNTSTFASGFTANLLLDANVSSGNLYVDQYVLNTGGSSNTYLGQLTVNGTSGASGTLGGINFALNDTNTAGPQGTSGAAADPTTEDSVATGLEIGIPTSDLPGYTAGSNVEVFAGIFGGGDGYQSNQFLPGEAVGSGDQTTGVFAQAAGQFFTVNAPATQPNGNWIQPNSGSWSTAANWSNGYIPNVAGDIANFAGATATSTVTLDGSHSVATLTLSSSTYSYTIAQGSGGTLTMDNGANSAAITDFSGSHFISAPVKLNSNTTVSVIPSASTVSISGNISGAGTLTVDNPGNGVVALSGTNTYGGGTTVMEGNLQLDSATALPTGTALTLGATDLPSGVLDLNGNSANVSSITVLTGPNTQNVGAVASIINSSAVAGTSTLTYAGNVANPSTFSGNLRDNSGSGGGTTALTVSSGSLTLTGTNTYGGNTNVNTGAVLTIASTVAGMALPSGGNVANNGSFIISSDTINTGTISGSGTTTVNSPSTLSALALNQGGLVNNGTVTTYANSTVGPMSGTGTLNISGGTFQLAQGSGVNTVGSLSIGNGEALDITNNALIINYGSGPDPISSIVAMIQNGYASDTWSGTAGEPSILSSNAQNNFRSYGIGYADSADPNNPAGLASGELELKYTLLGDANLDNKVNGADFTLMAANFNDAVTNGWDEGDFNYDNSVNGEDFVLLADNFNQFASQSAVSAADLAALDAFASANGINLSGTTSVPEPATLGLLTVAGAALLARRRRGIE